MADYILRPLDPQEKQSLGDLIRQLAEPIEAKFNLDYAAYNTQDTGTDKRFFHIVNETPKVENGEQLMSCLAVTDLSTSMVFGLYSITNDSGDDIERFELRTIDNELVWMSTTNNPLTPREPVEGEDTAMISSPSISNLRHHGGGRFTGQFDVSVLIFFSWDVGDPFDVDLW